ncbi:MULTISPECIES: photosystem II assembly protein Psb35 [unclassified Coleofasciculus]|uniref:photosystem II assembly protein Psb35 n=1 Tax=unclassified Coleofasciculus TaxID=2692782 RepID=UPI0018805FC6|nr:MULTISPECIES: hypothetical protein [unclassified Coleofasciculus]MBE9129951.1 hypothetical protein [Coleofasciculus sp. LEGE 07081]MBE9150404.1 hypothetical protein [Coleofasciculus sp. LEGE 07092]
MNLLMEAGVASASHFPISFTLVYVVGFIAAVTIGSIAWYNSKRPAGWENKERPNIVPKVETEDNASQGETKKG